MQNGCVHAASSIENRQPLADRKQSVLDLVETRGVVEVEEAVDLREVGVEAARVLPSINRSHPEAWMMVGRGKSRSPRFARDDVAWWR